MNKSTKTIPTHWKVDSLRLEIPKKYVDVSSKFTDNYALLNLETGEYTDLMPFQKKQMIEHVSDDGVKFYTRIYNRAIQDERGRFSKDKDAWLQVLLNAKMLGPKYFDGITNRTIESLYHKFMSLGHFKCTFEVFMRSLVFDVDFCKDFRADRSQMNDYVSDVAFKPNVSSVWRLKNGDVSTLQLNYREKGSSDKPYYKIYNKQDEFRSRERFEKLKLFYESNKIAFPESKHFRKEITLNSKKAFSEIVSDCTYRNTLNDAMALCDDMKGLKYVLDLLEVYRIKRIVQPKDFGSIPMLIGFIVDLEKENKLDSDDIIKKYNVLFKDSESSESTVKRLRKELKQQIELYDLARADLSIEMSREAYDEMNDLCFGL